MSSREERAVSAPEPTADPIVDREMALAHVDGDETLLRNAAAVFLENAGGMLTRIRDAVGRGDGVGLEQAAHAILGSVGILGARSAAAAARRLEALGREDDLVRAREAEDALRREIERLCPLLLEWTGGMT